MKQFILYRILWLVPTLLMVSFGVFAILRLGGGDPVMSYILHSNLPATPEMIQELRADFLLDKPLMQQYWAWLKHALCFDFGTSFMSGRSVSEDFFALLPNTCKLILSAFILACVCSIPLGIISAYYHNRFADRLIRVFCFIGVSIPNFWLAFLLVLCFSIYLGWLPAVGFDGGQSLILPSVSIALMSLCINARLIRTNMLEIKKERHVLYARMRGVNGLRLYVPHIFYNAFLPILTSMGMHIGELLGGALVIESVFGLPGVGTYSIQAIANHDYPVIECFIVVLCAVFVLCNLIVDIVSGMCDGRVRKELANRYKKEWKQSLERDI